MNAQTIAASSTNDEGWTRIPCLGQQISVVMLRLLCSDESVNTTSTMNTTTQDSEKELERLNRAVRFNSSTGLWFFEFLGDEIDGWASEDEFQSREDAVRACLEDARLETL